MINTVQQYISYFSNIVSQHVTLSESGPDVFQIKDIDEVMSSLIIDIPQGGRFFHLVLPSVHIQYNRSESHYLTAQCAFRIGKMYYQGDNGAQISAIQDTYNIAYDICERMVYDSRNGVLPLVANGQNNPEFKISTELINGDTCYAGVMVLFEIQQLDNFCSPNTSKWIDL